MKANKLETEALDKLNSEDLSPERIKELMGWYKCPEGHLVRRIALLGDYFLNFETMRTETGYSCPVCFIIRRIELQLDEITEGREDV